MATVDLRLGDCLELMRGLPDQSVDAVITDPPYGVGIDYGGAFVDNADYLFGVLPTFLTEANRIARVIIFPSGQYEVEKWLFKNYPPRWRLCWNKGAQSTASPIGFSDWEMLMVYGKDVYRASHDYMNIRPEPSDNGHPCPKPKGWADWLMVRFTNEGDTVLDPFMGSGTTGVACVKLNRNFIGMEINPAYFAIAQKRIAEAQMQMVMPL